ncbi:MAG: capsule assembly Wzi family protein [Terracidiphilus sp.]
MTAAQYVQGQGASGNAVPSGVASDCEGSTPGSPFIPVDSWIYPAVWRLYSLGFLDNVYLGVRPWTRASLSHMLEDTENNLEDADPGSLTDEAQKLYDAVTRELDRDSDATCLRAEARVESTYSATQAISGTPLHDSFHLGSTVVNDYGRPFENGLNNYSGASGYARYGRYTLYLRGEFQGAPSAAGYSPSLNQALAIVDLTTNPVTGLAYNNQATIPLGPISTTTQGRFLEAYVSTQILNHVISFGKMDEWLGPAEGGSFAYSNNAENIYAFHINRIEPLQIPVLSQITGPFRYEFLVGELRGHTLMPNPLYTSGSTTQPNVISPGDPWVHVEKISFKPTANLEFGFERTAMFGGEGHSPVTLHTFLKSFFSTSATSPAVKDSRYDPGARFGAFDFSYRLPFLRNWATLYADGEVHDDLSPIDAPRRASWRPGIYLVRVPGVPKLDFRLEASSTDPVSSPPGGQFMYWETIERQGYTNQGQIFGDWMGREDKGGQAWMTYHLSGNEWIQLTARTQKAAKDFIPGGTTLNDIGVEVEKRIHRDFAISGSFTAEHWKAPVYLPGEQTATTTRFQVTWYPRQKYDLR